MPTDGYGKVQYTENSYAVHLWGKWYRVPPVHPTLQHALDQLPHMRNGRDALTAYFYRTGWQFEELPLWDGRIPTRYRE
jgi:hypothetical protein